MPRILAIPALGLLLTAAAAAGAEGPDAKAVLARAREMLADPKTKAAGEEYWIQSAAIVAVETHPVDPEAGAALLASARKLVEDRSAKRVKPAPGAKPSEAASLDAAILGGLDLLEAELREPGCDQKARVAALRDKLKDAQNSTSVWVATIEVIGRVRPELAGPLAADTNVANLKVAAARALFDRHLSRGQIKEALAGADFVLGKWSVHEPVLAAAMCRRLAAAGTAEARKAAEECLARIAADGEAAKGERLYRLGCEQLACAAAGYAALDPERARKLRDRLAAVAEETAKSDLPDGEKKEFLVKQHMYLGLLSWLLREDSWAGCFEAAIKHQDEMGALLEKGLGGLEGMIFAPVKGMPNTRILREIAELDPACAEAVYRKFVAGRKFEENEGSRGAARALLLLVAEKHYAAADPAKALAAAEEAFKDGLADSAMMPLTGQGRAGCVRLPIVLAEVARNLRLKANAAKPDAPR